MAFSVAEYFDSGFKNVKKDASALREAAQAILSSGEKLSVGNSSYLGWARTALQQLDSYDARKAGRASMFNSQGEDLAARDLDRAFSFLSGAAQSNKAKRVLEMHGQTKQDIERKLQSKLSDIANVSDFSNPNLSAEEKGRLQARADAMKADLQPLIDQATTLGIKVDPKLTKLASGFVPTADLSQPAKVNIASEGGDLSPIDQAFTATDFSKSSGLSDLQKNVLGADANAKANDAFINGAFKAFHGRDATQKELDAYRDKAVSQVRNEIVGGAQAAGLPTVRQGAVDVPTGILTPDEAVKQGLQKVLRPDQLSAFSPDQIVRDNQGGIYLRAGAATADQLAAVAAGKSAADIVGRMESPSATADASVVERGASAPGASGIFGDFGSGASASEIMDTVAGAATGFLQKAIDAMDAQIKQMEADRVTAKADLGKLTARITDMAFGTTREAELKRVMAEQGITEKRARLSEVMSNIEAEKAKLNLGLIQERDKLAPMSIIGTRQNALREQAQATIGALAAVAQVYQDDLDFAKEVVNATVSAMNADRTDQLNALQFLVGLAKDDIVELRADERAVIEARSKVITEAMENAQKNADSVFDLIKQYPEAAVSAKVSLTDSPSMALSKMAPYLAASKGSERTQVIDLGGRKVLIDLNTGKEIKSFNEVAGVGSGPAKSEEEKQIEAFRKDSAETLLKLDAGDITWGAAYDSLKVKYPQASSALLDSTLGGGFNQETGKWWGRALNPEDAPEKNDWIPFNE